MGSSEASSNIQPLPLSRGSVCDFYISRWNINDCPLVFFFLIGQLWDGEKGTKVSSSPFQIYDPSNQWHLLKLDQ